MSSLSTSFTRPPKFLKGPPNPPLSTQKNVQNIKSKKIPIQLTATPFNSNHVQTRAHQSTHRNRIPLPPRHHGLIIAVSTTPPIILIAPLDGNHTIDSLTLSRNQLRDILDNLAAGAAQVSYTIQMFPHGCYAAEVQCTRVVDRNGGAPLGEHGRMVVPVLRSQKGLPEGSSTKRCKEWVYGAQEKQR